VWEKEMYMSGYREELATTKIESNSQDDELLRLRKITKVNNALVDLTVYNNIFMWWFVDQDFFIRNNGIRKDHPFIKRLKENPILYITYRFATSIVCKINMKLYTPIEYRNNNRILVVAQNLQWRTILDTTTMKPKKGDAFFDSILLKLRESEGTEIVTVYPLGYSLSDLHTIIDKRKNQKDIIHKPFDIYWSLNSWKKGRAAKNYFSKLWSNFKNANNLKKSSELLGINLDLLNDRISYYFNTIFGIMVEHIEMAKQMIDEERPDLILLLNEYGRFERSLLIAAKLKGVPTLAVQHGIITPTHHGYIFDKYYKDTLTLPDITCVYGQYYYELLTEKSIYDPEHVVITGQPRYDILGSANKIYTKEKFLKDHNVRIGNKIILWTTQCHGLSDDENMKYVDTIFKTIKTIKNSTLIIKQHPGEGSAYTKMLKKYIKTYDINSIITKKNSDTYELLYVCDLMITKNSTTAMEAVALEKPVVILNLSGKPDLVNYVEEGVALGVYKKEDLKPAIERLIRDDYELAVNREKYIEKYLYKIDGKSTDRVVGEISKILLKKNIH